MNDDKPARREPLVGDVYRDNDKRAHEKPKGERTVKVLALSYVFAMCEPYFGGKPTGRRTRIYTASLGTSTAKGYTLVRAADPEPT